MVQGKDCAAQAQRGRPAQLSDSEVLTLAIVGQWRVGVPWQSERGLVRYMQTHGIGIFPAMIGRSGFNRRVRHLWGVLVRLQQDLAEWLTDSTVIHECVDSLPLSVYSMGQGRRGHRHWLWDARIGYGPEYWFWGYRLLTSVTSQGVITGWLIGAADIQDRWLMEAFVSARAGQLAMPWPQARIRETKATHFAALELSWPCHSRRAYDPPTPIWLTRLSTVLRGNNIGIKITMPLSFPSRLA